MYKNCKEKLTIRSLINSLNNIMAENPNLNLDSEVIITDLSYQEFEDVFVYLSRDVYYNRDKVGLQLSPKKKVEPDEREGYTEPRLGDNTGVEEKREVQVNKNWWEKYR